MYRPLYLLSSIFVLASVVLLATTWERSTAVAEAPALEPLTKQEIEQRLDLADSSLQKLQIAAENGAPFEVPVSLDGQDYFLDMQPYSVRSADFTLLIADDAGIHDVVAPESRTYRGVVLRADGSEVAGSVVAGSMSDGKLTATIDLGEGPVWFVQSLADEGLTTDSSDHVVFNGGDVQAANAHCGVTDEFTGLVVQDEDAVTGPERSVLATGFKVAEIAFDADYHYFLENGSSATTTMFDIENVMNSVEFVYERDTDITYEITAIVVRTTLGSNPYSSSNCLTLLCQFRSQWNSVFPTSVVRRDVAHLMTGRNLGGCIGIAWLGVVCNFSGFSGDCGSSANLAYGLSESRFTFNFSARIALTAHELGHNWNAPHCDTLGSANCDIMCSIIGSCGGWGLPNFESSSISRIVNHRNSRICLFPSAGTLADPIPLPFIETFPTSGIDTAKWIYNDLVLTSTTAVGEPSATRSLALDSTGSGEFDQNEIRSNFILLQGQAEIHVVYWTEHRGVESGERLVVEYWGSNRRWNLVNAIVSDGITQDAFDQHVHKLTLASDPQALHNEFRIRFRTEGNESTDDWYVDDVCVGSATDCGLGCQEALDCDDDNDCTTDSCESGSCVNTFNTEPCDDGDACTDNDVCSGGSCGGTPECNTAADCNDGLACTTDSCESGCCVHADVVCSEDQDPCTNAACQEPGGCAQLPGNDGASCDDADPCTDNDVCSDGNCGGTPECDTAAECNDGLACTADSCEAECCVHTDVVCSEDQDPCTNAACQEPGGCTQLPGNDGVSCDDADPCTDNDVCSGGSCGGTPECDTAADCDDGLACTTDNCESGCCVHADVVCSEDQDPCTNAACQEPGGCTQLSGNDGASCDDGDPCTDNDVCSGGSCGGTPECDTAADCNDGLACSTDSCEAGCCVHTDVVCSEDQDPCTNAACQEPGGCTQLAGNDGASCDDGDPCTDNDVCSGGNCGGTPECDTAADCNDGLACTTDSCEAECCVHTDVVCSEDQDPCTNAGCQEPGGCTQLPGNDGASCEDEDLCTENDVCADGLCAGQATCDDGNACTVDSCDPEDGACTNDPIGCPEGESCNPANGECVVSCPEDLDTDGSVRVPDLIILLGKWGPCVGCPGDLDGDGEVRVPDLIIMLAAWGACS